MVAAAARHHRYFEDVESILKFILVAVLLAPIPAATIGATSLWLNGLVPLMVVPQTWLAWWIGDSMGVLLVAPFLLALPSIPKISFSPVKLLELAGVAALLIWLWFDLFMAPPALTLPPLSFVAIPLIIWVAMCFPVGVLASVLFIISLFAIHGTSVGHGPFVRDTLQESIAYLYGFLWTLASIGMFLGTAIAHNRRSVVELLHKNETLQASNLHLATAQSIGKFGSWEWNVVADQITGSDERLIASMGWTLPALRILP